MRNTVEDFTICVSLSYSTTDTWQLYMITYERWKICVHSHLYRSHQLRLRSLEHSTGKLSIFSSFENFVFEWWQAIPPVVPDRTPQEFGCQLQEASICWTAHRRSSSCRESVLHLVLMEMQSHFSLYPTCFRLVSVLAKPLGCVRSTTKQPGSLNFWNNCCCNPSCRWYNSKCMTKRGFSEILDPVTCQSLVPLFPAPAVHACAARQCKRLWWDAECKTAL